jgi:hypothetical protein
MRFLAILLIMAMALPAAAQETAPLPRERPEATTAAPTAETPATEPPPPDLEPEEEGLVPLPRPRPEPEADPPTVVEAPADETAPSKEPEEPEEPKPPRIYQAACPAVLLGVVEAKSLPPIAENQCGERSPLAVTGVLVNGRMVELSGEAIVNCGMATALPGWASAIDSYLFARENTRLERIIVGTSYMCRPRNNAAGADVSEHGFANALDVVGFVLEDGRTMSLPAGWTDAASPDGRLLRFAHDSGCAHFTTTLGPEANALHHDHLHLDLGCHGQRCVARLCE